MCHRYGFQAEIGRATGPKIEFEFKIKKSYNILNKSCRHILISTFITRDTLVVFKMGERKTDKIEGH